jgi:hypothetical protein
MYDVGDIVPLGITVTNAAGTPEDAGAVVLTVGLPDGTSVTPAVSHTNGTGVYTVDFTATLEGLHTVSWVATGANATAYRDVFNVREITDQIIGLPEARKQLRLGTSTDHDDDLRLFIAAATIAVEDHTGRKLVRRTITGERHRSVCGKLLLNRIPVISVTSVATLDGAITWDPDDLDLDPDIGLVTTLSGAGLYGDLLPVYVCGSRIIRANELLACRIIVEHLWQTMRPFAAASVPTVGALEDSLDSRAGGLVGFAIPNRALELLGKPPPLVA